MLRAEDSHYLVMFAAQGPDAKPRFTHTFATFVKMSDSNGTSEVVAKTISWMPASGVIVPAKLLPEPGANFTLERSLEWAANLKLAVIAWGPIPIQQELFELAERRSAFLESGKVGYKMVDLGAGAGVNCIYAVCGLVPGGALATGAARGEQASLLVLQHLRRWFLDEPAPDGLIAQLGLDRSNITFRKLEQK
ncbi:MAG: hypothetical protein L0Y72_29570 [Gemmataceae bacterium]|nr:hypothetical protein [Gemmataceae bacterium]MCI0743196.1 hypothetical protein [Gemmataceae bacterium]